MVAEKNQRLSRDDCLRAALRLCTSGIDQVKIAPLAADMGVTTGSFYWHFKNRRELLEVLLDYWGRDSMTRRKQDLRLKHAILTAPEA